MPKPSPFVWYDVMTTDTKAATDFYTHVVGWTARANGMNDMDYTILGPGETMVAGLMPIPPDAKGMPPMWTGYIHVDDVDAMAKKVTAAGGKIMREPADIPNVGRFAVAADPHGAGFLLFKPNSDQQPAPVAKDAPGHIGWRELMAGNGEEAFTFYAGLFGWTKTEALDMGEMGVYQMFGTGGESVGAMMTKPPECPHPSWRYYFNVPSIDAAVTRINERKGTITWGPMEVPGGQWVVQVQDPQGAHFGLVAPGR